MTCAIRFDTTAPPATRTKIAHLRPLDRAWSLTPTAFFPRAQAPEMVSAERCKPAGKEANDGPPTILTLKVVCLLRRGVKQLSPLCAFVYKHASLSRDGCLELSRAFSPC